MTLILEGFGSNLKCDKFDLTLAQEGKVRDSIIYLGHLSLNQSGEPRATYSQYL